MRAQGWAAFLVSGIVIALPVSASASGDLLSPSEGSPLTFENLAPGSSRVGVVQITNPAEEAATIALQVQITDELEGGCLRQEVEFEADDCDASGELGDWLDVSISRDDQQLWTGAMTNLSEPLSLPGSLGAGDSWDLQLEVEMPFEAGNDTMSDRIEFDLVAHATTDTREDTDVLGAQGSGPGSGETGDGVLVPIAVDAGMHVMGLETSLRDMEPERLITLGTFGFVAVLVLGLVVVERRRNRPW